MNTVRPAVGGDVGAIARLHAACIREGFLTSLGPAFLERLYGRVVRSRHAFALVDGDPGDVHGFVAVAADLGAFYREFFVRDGVLAAIAAARGLVRAPRRALETLGYGMRRGRGRGAPGAPRAARTPEVAEILAVALEPHARGRGRGAALVEGALAELARRGHAQARVLTAAGNEAAIRTYERAGFRRDGTDTVHRGVAQGGARVAVSAPLAAAAAAAVALGATPVAAAAARRVGLVDRPGPLKVQDRPVPYLGGLGVLAALGGPVALTRPSVLVPLGAAAALGLADDRHDLPPGVRLAAQVGVGLAVGFVAPGGGGWRVVLAVAVTAVLLNAVNLLDGLDGLAAGVGLASAVGFALVLGGSAAVLAGALGGALAGFAVWNRPPARVYLGDAGSYLIGAALAVLLMAATAAGTPAASGSLLFVGVPVADTAVAVVRRTRAGRPLLRGDRGHVYDQLVDRGWSVPATVLACAGAQAVLGAAGIAITSLPAAAAAATAAAVIAVVGVAAIVAFTDSPPTPPTSGRRSRPRAPRPR